MFGRFFFAGVERNRYHTSSVIVRYLSGKATSMIGGWRALNRLRHLRVAFDKSEGHPRVKARPPAGIVFRFGER